MNFPKQQILALCLKYGPQLRVPASIDGPRLMYAIAYNESSVGANCTPRHEPAYDKGGLYASNALQAKLLAKFGRAAACSYGPWQVMYVNASQFTPDELQADAEKCAQAFVAYVNTFVLGIRKAPTVLAIAETYNSGNYGPNVRPNVLKYARDAEQHYAESPFTPSPAKAVSSK